MCSSRGNYLAATSSYSKAVHCKYMWNRKNLRFPNFCAWNTRQQSIWEQKSQKKGQKLKENSSLKLQTSMSIFQCKYNTVPHTQSFHGEIKYETTLRLAVPWPQLFNDEKKAQGEATAELTPRRFQYNADLVCDYLMFDLLRITSRRQWFRDAIYSPVLNYSCCHTPRGKKGPWRGIRDAHASRQLEATGRKVQDSLLYLHTSP